MITQKEFENKWHGKLVKPNGYYNIPNKEYFVTACLLDGPPEKWAKFAIMATDYSLSNKHYITFDLASEEIEKLDERFEILGDYNNIDFEILFTFLEEKQVDEVDCWITKWKNFTQNTEGHLPASVNDFKGAGKGDRVYDFGFISTNGEKLRKSYILKFKDWGCLTDDEIYQKFNSVRQAIKGGLYHFLNLDEIYEN